MLAVHQFAFDWYLYFQLSLNLEKAGKAWRSRCGALCSGSLHWILPAEPHWIFSDNLKYQRNKKFPLKEVSLCPVNE